MSDDLIKRKDAIKAYNEAMEELVKWQMEEWQLGDFSECEFNTTDCKHIARKIEAIPSADRPQGDVDAVYIFEREMHNLEQGYITLGEFDERIEPLRHLCYGRPQGEWIEVDDYFIRCKCSICGWESHKYEDDVYGMPYCPNCGARMFAKDINAPNKKGVDDEISCR